MDRVEIFTTETNGQSIPSLYANTITRSDLEKHLQILASDDFEGRETGTPGQQKAAAYLADQLEKWNLPRIGEDQTYFQRIYFLAQTWKKIAVEVNGEKIRHLWDFYAYPRTNSTQTEKIFHEVLFLGYGIDDEHYSDYKGVDVTGKAILIYAGEPANSQNKSLISRKKEPSDWAVNWRRKLKAAKMHGVEAVFIIDPEFKKNVRAARKEIISSQLQLGKGEEPEQNYANNYFITSSLAQEIIGKNYRKVIKARKKIKRNGQPKQVLLPCTIQINQTKSVKSVIGENVLAYIEGSDEKQKEELVIITAHYDHIGRRGETIFNGADDNGSGTATVLEVCEAYVKAKKQGQGPRRSVLMMLVSGEEKGLLGSEYYTKHPIFPLENSIANINVDMVGRVDKKHTDNPNYVYVIGADRLSTDLHTINEEMNDTYTQLELDYTFNARDDRNRFYYRSDHYNFAKLGIPAIFYFNGPHADYHRSTDTIGKIHFGKMEKIARLIFYTSWELANREERIQVDVTNKD